MKSIKPRRAFTLTELLVVVAIIAVLLAVALVAFRKVTAMARTSACLANQRQISLAQTSYATDNGGAFASPCTSFRGLSGAFTISSACGEYSYALNSGRMTNAAYHSWTASYPGTDSDGNPQMNGGTENEGALRMGRLFSYIGAIPVYRSPLDPTGRLRSYSLNCFVGVTVPNDVSNYGKAWVDWYCAQGVTPREWVSTHLSRIKQPSQTIMSIVEQDGAANGFNTHGWVIDPRPPAGSQAPDGTPNPGAWAIPSGWAGWIDTPAMWAPNSVTYSNVDGSTATYAFASKTAIAAMTEMQNLGQSHSFVQPPDVAGAALRVDWMFFRDRLLPGVIPPMVPRYQAQ